MKKQSRAKNSPPKTRLVAAGSANSVECLLASLLASRDRHSLAEVTVCRTLQVAIPGDEAKQRSLVCPGVLRQVLNEAQPGHFTVPLWESRERAIAIRRRCNFAPPAKLTRGASSPTGPVPHIAGSWRHTRRPCPY